MMVRRTPFLVVLLGLLCACGTTRSRHAAAPPPPVTARARAAGGSADHVRAIEASGPSDEPWTRAAPAVFRTPSKSAGPAHVRAAAPRCFHDGCIIAVTYPDRAAFEAFDRSIASNERFE